MTTDAARSSQLARLFLPMLWLVCWGTSAANVSGRVIHVIDGSALIVLLGERRVTVRLGDIDAPRHREPYAIASRQSLSAICGGELATLHITGKSRNDGMVAQVTCAGRNANAEQVRRGMAWVSWEHAQADSTLHLLESEARRARRGLWSRSEPTSR